MLTLITPTGARPAAFDLCQRMMVRQTYKEPVRWIIVDDGEVPSKITIQRAGWKIDVIRPEPFWNPGDNTQGRNLNLALDAADPESVLVFIEDDDWYSPQWLDEIARRSKNAELVGECDAIYYNVRSRRYSRLANMDHASLRCSAIRGQAIDTFREVLKTPYRYYDMRLWKEHGDKAVFESRFTVGMKGLPGRPGIALGHDYYRGNSDRNAEFLRTLIGNDADWYLPFYEESGMTEKYIVLKAFRHDFRNWKPGEFFTSKKRIDVELHLHAKKIARAAEAPKPAETPRKMEVESQAKKLKETVVEKTTETETADEPQQESPAEPEQPEAPKYRGRKKAFGI